MCIISIIPFAIYRTLVNDWAIAIVDWAIVVSQLCCLYVSYRYESYESPAIIIALLFSAGSLASIYTAGLSQIYWLYPAIVAAYFLTGPIKGSLIALATIIMAAYITLIPNLATRAAVTVIFTLFATSSFGYIFAYLTAQRDKALSALARTDDLTGAGNRRALGHTLEKICTSPEESAELNFSLIIFDIDNFKQINDEHGHLIGDQVLIRIKQIINALTSKPNDLYRYGGDEFIYISSNRLSAEERKINFEHLTYELKYHAIELGIDRITVSLGLAYYVALETQSQWLSRADKALLNAKRNGKNQIFIDPLSESLLLDRQ